MGISDVSRTVATENHSSDGRCCCYGTRGFDDSEEVSSSSPKMIPKLCLASNFSEVSSWFIDDSSEETSSSSSSKSVESSSPPSSSESRSLFLAVKDSTSSSHLRLPLLSLDAILRRRES
jgi:hypothetical protein